MNSILLAAFNSKYIHSSLAVRYLKSMIEQDIKVGVVEYTINENIQDIIEDIISRGYRVVAFSCYIWNIEMIVKVSETIKKIVPELKVLFGGPEVSYDAREVMEKHPWLDFVVRGEGEIALKQFAEYLLGRREIEQVCNLTYRSQDGIEENPLHPLIEDFSLIPEFYMQSEQHDFENKIVYYEASRGCTYRCAYCLSSISKRVRFFPLDRVKRELKHLVELGVKQIKFVDRTFNYNKEYMVEMLEYLISIDDGNINFHFEITASLLDKEVLSVLKQVRKGLFQFEIGVQSTNDLTLKSVYRPNQFNKIREIVQEIKEGGNIHQHLDLIAGLPFETLEVFRTSFNDVFDLQPEMLQLGFLKLLKGTPMCELVQAHGIVYTSYPPYEVLKTNYLSYADVMLLKQVDHLVDRYYNTRKYTAMMSFLYRRFYLNKGFDLFCEFQKFAVSSRRQVGASEEFYLLYEFLRWKTAGEEEGFLRDIVCFDAIMTGRKKKLPALISSWLEAKEEDKNFLFQCLQRRDILEELGFDNPSSKNLFKKTGYIFLRYDIIKYLKEGKCEERSCLMIVNYEKERDFSGYFPYVVIDGRERGV